VSSKIRVEDVRRDKACLVFRVEEELSKLSRKNQEFKKFKVEGPPVPSTHKARSKLIVFFNF